MSRRPWFVVILAFFYWVAPIGNILFSANLYQIDVLEAFRLALFHSSPLEFFKTFLLLPLCGFSIYAYKRWSYTGFVMLNLLSFYFNFEHWRASNGVFSLPTMCAAYAFNFLIVSYFLIPKVRMGYFDSSLRWWESKPRYQVDLMGDVAMGRTSKKCHITDFSEGGLFMQSTLQANLRDKVRIEFDFLFNKLSIEGEITHVKTDFREHRIFGYGLKFRRLKEEDEQKIFRIVRALSVMKVAVRNHHTHWTHDFQKWLFSLFTTGRGLVPAYCVSMPKVVLIQPEVQSATLKRRMTQRQALKRKPPSVKIKKRLRTPPSRITRIATRSKAA